MAKTTAGETDSPKRKSARRELMQREIFEQATRLFAERGYAGTSFQDIADAVGLTRPALYHYVSSKDELLAQLVAEVTVVAATDIGKIARRTGMSATDKLREMVRLLVRHQAEQGERFRLLLRAEADLPESVAVSYSKNRRSVLRSLTSVIELGVAQGEFRPVTPTVAAFGTLGLINWVAWWYHPGLSLDIEKVCVELADQAVQGVAAEEGRPQSRTPGDALRSVRREIDRLGALLQSE
jgi:AcrR family transcriptional regulator